MAAAGCSLTTGQTRIPKGGHHDNIAGCGSSRQDGADKRESVRLMVWSPSEDQSKDSGEWLQRTCEAFAAEHPEWDITFVYGEIGRPHV